MSCIVCDKETSNKFCSDNCRQKDYRFRFPDKVKESKHKHYLKFKDKILSRDKARYLENPEKARQQCKNWYNKNKEYRKEYTAKYRKENRALFIRLKDEDRFDGKRFIVLERDGYKCIGCYKSENLAVHHIDGSGLKRVRGEERPNNDLSNLVTLCGGCHTRLHAYQRKFKMQCITIDDIVRTMVKVIEYPWRISRKKRVT